MHPEAVCYKESFLLAKPEEALHDFWHTRPTAVVVAQSSIHINQKA